MRHKGENREVNIEPGFINNLRRLYLEIRSGIEEIRDPLCGSYTWTMNFKEGVKQQIYCTYNAMVRRSIKMDKDSWNYDEHDATFLKKDDVHVALVLPTTWNPKYIHGFTMSGKEVIASMPVDYHVWIAGRYHEMTGEEFRSIKGGRIERADGKLRLYGTSRDFGPANHERVAGLLNKLGISAEAGK